jgi:hypothetical protein
MEYDFTGVVKHLNDIQTWDSGFRKREIIVASTEVYPQDIKFELLKDDVDLVNDIAEGENVLLKFELRGNEWKDKYFVNLVIKSIQVVDAPEKVELPTDDNSDIPF